jgi:thiazole synthase
MQDVFTLAGKAYESRLLVGTGKYKNMEETRTVIEASGAQIVTVALRRMDLSASGKESIQSAVDPKRYTYLPNTAGCSTAKEAVRTLRLARELGGWNLVKLEIVQEHNMLLPDIAETLAAAKELVADGFEVMAYTTDDADVALEL